MKITGVKDKEFEAAVESAVSEIKALALAAYKGHASKLEKTIGINYFHPRCKTKLTKVVHVFLDQPIDEVA